MVRETAGKSLRYALERSLMREVRSSTALEDMCGLATHHAEIDPGFGDYAVQIWLTECDEDALAAWEAAAGASGEVRLRKLPRRQKDGLEDLMAAIRTWFARQTGAKVRRIKTSVMRVLADGGIWVSIRVFGRAIEDAFGRRFAFERL